MYFVLHYIRSFLDMIEDLTLTEKSLEAHSGLGIGPGLLTSHYYILRKGLDNWWVMLWDIDS